MAECKAYGCTNNKRRNRGKHFFCVPKPTDDRKTELAKRWLHNIGTGYTLKTFPFGRNSVVCEDHFKPTCYLRDLQAELLGTKPKLLRLKPDAFPTEFLHKKSKEDEGREQRLAKRNQSKMISELLQSSASGTSLSTPATTVSKTKQHSTENITGPCYQPSVCDASCQTDPVQMYPFEARVIVLDEDTAVHLSRTANTCGITRDHSYHTSKTNVPLPSITINDAPVISGSRSNDVMNTQSLRELFQFCGHCHKECRVTIEGRGGLLTVTQDCQSCGHHKDWRSHPPSAEAPQPFRNDGERALTNETEVVVQIVSSDNEYSEKAPPGMDGSYLASRDDEEASQDEDEEEVKKKRKRKSKGKDSSDEWEPSSCEEDSDSASDSEEDPLTVFKEDGQGKLVVWCAQCETEASRSCSVFQHQKLLCCAECAPDDVKTYTIDILPVRFDDIVGFKRHVEQEHGVKLSFTLCQECGTFFRPRKEHVCEHKLKSVVCPDCGKRFHTEIGLKAHRTTVHSENDHACKYCLKAFKTRSAKLEHEQSHPKETPFACPHCPEKFRYVNDRNRHLKSHRGPCAWVCDVCEKGFTGSYKLKKHKLVHTGEKPFKCKVCRRSFSQLENLGTHMRLHTGEKPFLCDQCGESFTHKVSLKNHKQRHHDSALTQEDRRGVLWDTGGGFNGERILSVV